ncbi:endonuclease MutS2 [Alicyclobacillus kakegawensis]|uniref:endonuclease MutS2 n=1 Tax=Alicyclobacillus kakegawensis TaxID=392012 RepID=UPI001FDFDD6F|nr:endonuclease MutS2 [Alicyclobacillus kakegawensis]
MRPLDAVGPLPGWRRGGAGSEDNETSMDERTYTLLEFDKVIERMAERAATSLGRERLSALRCFSVPEDAERELAAVDESLQMLLRFGPPPFAGVTDVRGSLRSVRIGGTLSPESLVAVADFMQAVRRIRQFMERHGASWPSLTGAAQRLTPTRAVEEQIRHAIDVDGTVLDQASSALRRLRSERRAIQARVREVLDGFLRSHAKILQEPVVAMRGNSLCLPVRVEFKNQIRGIIRDYSASGATVFIEPQAVVEQNQRAERLAVEEEREIERILHELSQAVGGVADVCEENLEVVARLDSWFAKAEWARHEEAQRPTIRRDGVWRLRRARHPLLPRGEAVPLDMSLGESFRLLIITGPNTGGKTVTLKTVGLLTLLAMCGCFLPTQGPSEVAWCREICVDIGDEQSIEQSLSTFSSHMRNIVSMLQTAGEHSLVLLDELGAGTDPSEGAALAMAILDEFYARGSRVVATTHYPELKAYAFSHPSAMNASVEFDVDTLRPTYRLRMGVPGRSNALTIAARLGLPEAVIERARQGIADTDVQMEDLIAKMETARKEAERALQQAAQEQAQAQKLREDWERRTRDLDEQARQQQAAATAAAERILESARREAESVIQELRQLRAEVVKDHELVALRKRLEQARPEPGERAVSTPPAADVGALVPGTLVRVPSVGQKGEVLEVSADGRELVVQLGLLRMKVAAGEVEVLNRPAQAPKSTGVRRSAVKSVPLQMDVRGETVDEAVHRLDKYLDDAVVARLPRVTIIHGKGTGALRDGVRRFLSAHRHVSSWAPGGPGEGGDGATVVTLAL